jgi:protein-S-isoprenylcysteine O-methyltransferase Ste14
MSADHRRTGWMLLAVQVALLIAIVLVPPADHWPTPSWVLGLASLLTLGGMVVVVLAALRLGRALTTSASEGRDVPVQRDGLYRWVRHPMYSGLLALVIGVALRSGNVLAAVLALVIVVFFHEKAAWEEGHLRARSSAYDAYASVTPRFVPRPRSGRTRR